VFSIVGNKIIKVNLRTPVRGFAAAGVGGSKKKIQNAAHYWREKLISL